MVLPLSFSRKMGEIETVEAEKMGWLDLPRGTSYPTFPYRSNLRSQRVKKVKFSQNRAILQKIAIISITILASRIVRQPNDSPVFLLSICALRLAVSLIQ